MRITKKRSYKKPIIAIIIFVVIVGGTFGYLYYTHKSKSSVADQTTSTQGVNLDPPTQAQVQAGASQKQSTIENSSKDDANTTPTPTNTTLTVTLTASNTSNGVQQLRYLIGQQLSGGTCTLTLTNGSQTITRTASVQALASTSTCQGFDISTSDLSSGTWTAALTVADGTLTGSVSSTFEV